MNHLCKLVSDIPQWESENTYKLLEGEKRQQKYVTEQFIKRMKLTQEKNLVENVTIETNTFFRSSKRLLAPENFVEDSKRR